MRPDRALLTAAAVAVALGVAAWPAHADGPGDGPQQTTGDAGALTGRPAEPAPPPIIFDEIIGILDIRVEGMSDTASEVLTKGVAAAVGKAGYMVVLPDRLREVMTTTPFNSACRVGPCLLELHKQANVDLVLVAAIVAIGANHDYVVTLVDTTTGLPIEQIQRTCDVCTIDEAISSMAAASIELVVKSAGRAPEPIIEPPPPRIVHPPPRRRLWRAGVALIGTAVVAASSGLMVHEAHPDLGAGLVGAGATLAVAGGACLTLRF